MFTDCYFLLLTRMCTCETITLARRNIGMERLYEGKEEIALQTIYRLPNISPFQNDLSIMPYITCFLQTVRGYLTRKCKKTVYRLAELYRLADISLSI